MTTVISVENLSKTYHLGQIGTGTFAYDLSVWWAKMRGKPNPLLRIGETDYGNRDGEELWAIKDVSFTVEQGEVLGIIGRNGAGKSTLLKIFSRVTAPTRGRIRVRGRVASLLEVGTGFHPELTGRENIYLNGAILGMTKQEVARKFDEIVDFAEVEKFIDTPVKRYSSGMYVRLAFAVAAHLEPEILLVDEVLAVGDVEFQQKCLGKMGDVAKEGRTVFFVSHNMLAVESLCQRGIFLNSGGIQHDGSVSEAISVYLDSIDRSAQLDISQRTDRPGAGTIRLQSVEIFCDGKKTGTFIPGKPVSFHFHVSTWNPQASCIFTIYDQYSQSIATFDSASAGVQDSVDPDSGNCFVCELNKLTLYPGRYRINVALYVGKELHDHLEGVAIFEVEPGWLEGRAIYPNNYAKVYLEHRWKSPEKFIAQEG